MAAKNKSKKNTKQKRTAAKKGKPIRKVVGKKPVVKKTTSKKTTPKKVKLKRSASRATNASRKAAGAKTVGLSKKRTRRSSSNLNTDPFASQEIASESAGQSGDLQGLSNIERADSESVDELIEEGNAFEADAVMGVESAEDEQEVRTHEVPEDDVPEEYLDKD
jgi:N utilization substance protein A